MTNKDLPICTDGAVAGGVRLWRSAAEGPGPLWATVVVKATFRMAHDRPATPAPPEPVVRDDRTFGGHPMKSVERASEIAPYLARCDVLCTGHAFAPAPGATSMSARLAVYRDRTALVDRTIHVFGDRSAGAPAPFDKVPLTYEKAFGGPGAEANPVGTATPQLVDPKQPQRPAAFGPVSRFWPVRKARIAGLDAAGLVAAIGVFPDSFPWDFLQAAPPEQQASYLAGNEWIVLDGMTPGAPRLQTRLPEAIGAARLVTATLAAPIPLQADMCIVDADRGTCAIVWRGRIEVPGGEAGLDRAAFAVGLEQPRKPVAWDALVAQTRATLSAPPSLRTPVSPPIARPAEAVGEGTLGLSDAQQQAVSRRSVAPFQVAAPSAAPSSKRDVSATPWGGAVSAPAPRSDVGEATIAADPAPSVRSSFGAPPASVPVPSMPVPSMPVPSMPVPSMPVPSAAEQTTTSAREAGAIAPEPEPGRPGATWREPTPYRRPVPKAAPEKQANPKPARAATFEDRFRKAGATASEIGDLNAALRPPPPPPIDDAL